MAVKKSTKSRRSSGAKSKSKAKFRASWRGSLRFGLVALDVQAINAEVRDKGEVHFHLLHAPDHQRIHYAKICPRHGEVPDNEIIEGYETKKGEYVEFAKEELDALRTAREKALTIDAFVDPSQIDPIYFDGRVYYLIPSGNSGSEPYALLLTAMERKHRWGVGQVVFSGREQLALIRPRGGLLLMAMLKYEDELRLGRDVGAAIQHSRAGSQSLKLAEALIGQWGTDSFDITQYRDRYREKVQAAISEKQQGHEVAAPQEEEPEVINLMDALKRSVAHAKGAGSAARPSSSSARKPKRKATKPTAKKRTSGRQRRKTA